jgi:RluA family pseudouridine synthase
MTLKWRQSRSARLIDAVKEQLDSSCSARFIKRALEANICRVNGRIERFGSKLLEKGDIVELAPNWDAFESKRNDSCSIIYEDGDLLAIDKSAGVVCTDAYFRKVLKQSLYLAHRLDKDTTGVLLFAKDPKIAEELQNCFEQRSVEKEYLALVDGIVEKESGCIKSYLVKKGSFQGQTIWGSSPSCQGLLAETCWERLACQKSASLLSCRPKTGRTHQIRIHLAEMGHPILIDRQYASQFRSKLFASRPLLHAHRLSLEWNHRSFSFEAPLAADFLHVLKNAAIPYDPMAY